MGNGTRTDIFANNDIVLVTHGKGRFFAFVNSPSKLINIYYNTSTISNVSFNSFNRFAARELDQLTFKLIFSSEIISRERLATIKLVTVKKVVDFQLYYHGFKDLAKLNEFAIHENILNPALNTQATLLKPVPFVYDGLVSCQSMTLCSQSNQILMQNIFVFAASLRRISIKCVDTELSAND